MNRSLLSAAQWGFPRTVPADTPPSSLAAPAANTSRVNTHRCSRRREYWPRGCSSSQTLESERTLWCSKVTGKAEDWIAHWEIITGVSSRRGLPGDTLPATQPHRAGEAINLSGTSWPSGVSHEGEPPQSLSSKDP